MLIFIHRVVLTAVRVRGEEQQDGRGDGGVDGHRQSAGQPRHGARAVVTYSWSVACNLAMVAALWVENR